MRVPRIAAIALLGTAAFGASATAAYADDSSGRIETSPHAVLPGHVVRLSTESCHWCGPAKVHLTIDDKRYNVWLKSHTSEGKTGWFRVPKDTDPGKVSVEGRCAHGREVEGSFWVKKVHHERHHHR
jgi:hypothetical protein